ncbi:hypothetical protein ACQ4LE_006527 [Meloidogyne hapla]|uniref:Thioredoxin-like_fold domain-containing protein n=1 Tax=Meloidogyne hapla TaxID=6305 RepID=A0A1I8BW03_MELHA
MTTHLCDDLDENSPVFTASELANNLGLGADFADYLSKQVYDENDPFLVINFVDMSMQDRKSIHDALVTVNVGAIHIESSGNVFKFKTWPQLFEAKEKLLASIPWVFYTDDVKKIYVFNGKTYKYKNTPTATSIVASFLSDKKYTTMSMQFFKF